MKRVDRLIQGAMIVPNTAHNQARAQRLHQILGKGLSYKASTTEIKFFIDTYLTLDDRHADELGTLLSELAEQSKHAWAIRQVDNGQDKSLVLGPPAKVEKLNRDTRMNGLRLSLVQMNLEELAAFKRELEVVMTEKALTSL